jgi:hypothetical protein
MDGLGSIQVNHSRKQSLQYRLIIKLSELAPVQRAYPGVRVNQRFSKLAFSPKVKDQQAKAHPNYNMLVEIAKVIGGTVRIIGKGGDVI